MSNTSQPQDCITISSDPGIIAQEITTIDTSTWNMSSGASYYYTGSGIGGGSDTILSVMAELVLVIIPLEV